MINLNQGDHQVTFHYQVLSQEERKRAARFHFERHRRRYIVSQGVMRRILSSYTEPEPGGLDFVIGDHGKPSLAATYRSPGLHFNLTHSHEIAILAVTLKAQIGVDVEHVREMEDIDSIAGRFFSTTEQAFYFSLPENQRTQGFFNCWTRKEAFIKAIGEGLSYPLHRFDVSLIPGEPARLLHIETDPAEASHWTLEAFSPALGYTAAVALRARTVRFKRFWYEEEKTGED